MSRIEVTIDELVLKGIDPSIARRWWRDCAELSRVLAEPASRAEREHASDASTEAGPDSS